MTWLAEAAGLSQRRRPATVGLPVFDEPDSDDRTPRGHGAGALAAICRVRRAAHHPDTDIDKLAAYWGNIPNVRFTDIRPLMEALKALPEGGDLLLYYLLPKFARDRLYTFPLPPQPGDPMMDCHWTTFNFSSDTPDNRFNDPEYTIQYIKKNYYQIAAPSQYGDILLLLNDKNQIKHSAVLSGRRPGLHQKRKQLPPGLDADAHSRPAGHLSRHAAMRPFICA